MYNALLYTLLRQLQDAKEIFFILYDTTQYKKKKGAKNSSHSKLLVPLQEKVLLSVLKTRAWLRGQEKSVHSITSQELEIHKRALERTGYKGSLGLLQRRDIINE